IAWVSDEAWTAVRSTLRGPGRRAGRPHLVAPGVVSQDGEIHVTGDVDAGLALRAAAAAAERGTMIDHDSLDRLADAAPVMSGPWLADSRADLVALLQAGGRAVRVIEALDQRRVWERVLPEW